jgi:hypothetical protein
MMTNANAANNLSNSLLAKRPRHQVEESSEDISCAPQCKKGYKDTKNAEKSEIVSVLSNSEDEEEEVKMMVTS